MKRPTRVAAVAGWVIVCGSARLGAQLPRCDGARISSVEITPGRPPFSGAARQWQMVARAIGLHHATTSASVINAYLLLRQGDVCTEVRRAESERVLRALPFIADASVRAVPDDNGGVRIEVTTVDEIPVLVSGAVRGGGPSALTLGNANVGGEGLGIVVGAERGFAYRNGGHLDVTQYAAFGQPVVANFDGAQEPRSSLIDLGLALPFRSDLQRGSWEADYRTADDYPTVARSTGDDLALELRSERWSVGGIIRSRIGPLVALVGGIGLSDRLTPATVPVFVTDSGFRAGADTLLRQRYHPFNSTRPGGLVGVRRVSYQTISGLDALYAAQDVISGVQLGTLVAPGSLNGHVDVLTASTVYAGRAGRHSLLAVQADGELHRDWAAGEWNSMIGSMRAAAYRKLGDNVLATVSDEFSSIRRSLVPALLTLSDPEAGVRGYGASTGAGTDRNVMRAELRWAHRALVARADAGFALFADAGVLHRGDAPYGQDASGRSVGVSLLAAYPSGSKRVYRVDLALPVQPSVGGQFRGIEVRFTSGDPTAAFWVEPGEVTQARLAPVPSSLFTWPSR